jgi:5-methylcytosine-specific restriction endonuclease McrA
MRLLKPSRLDRLGRKNTKRLAKARAKRLKDERDRFTWQLVRAAVYNRDGGKCRVCQKALMLHSRDPYQEAHTHHVVYRSRGGTDEMSNLVTICGLHHAMEHQHTLGITGTADRLRIEWMPQ